MLEYDFEKLASTAGEADELELVGRNDDDDELQSLSYHEIEEMIRRYKGHRLLVLKDTTKLESHIRRLEAEKNRRDREMIKTPAPAKIKQGMHSPDGLANLQHAPTNVRTPKENGIVDLEACPASAPAFQKDIRFHRFSRNKKPCLTQSINRTQESSSRSLQQSTGKEAAVSMTARRREKLNGGTPDSAVVLFSSEDEDESSDACRIRRDHFRTRRISLRNAERQENLTMRKIAYPSTGDPEAVEVLDTDLHYLRPMEFLNDTVIDFYIKYLQRPESLNPDQKEHFHFFSSFFYKKLTEAVVAEGKHKGSEEFSKLRKWTKGIDVFNKSYLVIPINDKLHWSLAIVCLWMEDAPGRVLIPSIWHLDSLEAGHWSKEIFKNIRKYLEMEYSYLHNSCQVKWKEIKTERVEVPRQENEYDCGLFLLCYIERFVEKAEYPCRLEHISKLFCRKWFRAEEASGMRERIKELLESLFQQQLSS